MNDGLLQQCSLLPAAEPFPFGSRAARSGARGGVTKSASRNLVPSLRAEGEATQEVSRSPLGCFAALAMTERSCEALYVVFAAFSLALSSTALPCLTTWRARPIASASAGTSAVMTEPVAT